MSNHDPFSLGGLCNDRKNIPTIKASRRMADVKPIPVQLSYEQARNALDRGCLIFLAPAGMILKPEDFYSELRRKQAYHYDTWMQKLVDRKAWDAYQRLPLYRKFELILENGLNDPNVSIAAIRSSRRRKFFSFWVFEFPDVHVVDDTYKGDDVHELHHDSNGQGRICVTRSNWEKYLNGEEPKRQRRKKK